MLLMGIAILSKVTGFLRDITLSHFYGASSISDAYIISITITSVLFSLVVLGISTAYIPMYKQIEYEDGTKSAASFTNHLINFVLLTTTVLIVTGILWSKPIVRAFAIGFDGETLELAITFTKIGLISIYFTSLTQLFTSHLQLKGKFVIAAMIGLPFNLIVILAIFISYQWNVLYLAIGSVLAAFVQLVFLFPSLRTVNYQFAPKLNVLDKNLKKLLLIVFPIMIGISIDQINLMVDKTLASTLLEGGISALTYASRLNDFVQGIFVLSFVSVMFPHISNLAAKKEIAAFKGSVGDVLSCITVIVVPASVGIMVLADPIIRLLYGHGHFDERAINMTAHALFFYSIGMIGYAFREVLNRSFYSFQDSKTPMYNAALAVGLNIVLNIVLSSFMGISGLALATSISALFCSALLISSLQRKVGGFGLKGILATFVKVSIASAVMGALVFFMDTILLAGWLPAAKMAVVIGTGVFVYFGLVTLLRVEEAKTIIFFVRRKLRRRL